MTKKIIPVYLRDVLVEVLVDVMVTDVLVKFITVVVFHMVVTVGEPLEITTVCYLSQIKI